MSKSQQEPGNKVCHKLILRPQRAAVVGDWRETHNGRKRHHFFQHAITMTPVFTNFRKDCGQNLPGVCMTHNAPQWLTFDSQPCSLVAVSLSKTPLTQHLPTAPLGCLSHVMGQRQKNKLHHSMNSHDDNTIFPLVSLKASFQHKYSSREATLHSSHLNFNIEKPPNDKYFVKNKKI